MIIFFKVLDQDLLHQLYLDSFELTNSFQSESLLRFINVMLSLNGVTRAGWTLGRKDCGKSLGLDLGREIGSNSTERRKLLKYHERHPLYLVKFLRSQKSFKCPYP